jgi:hypothetical protein
MMVFIENLNAMMLRDRSEEMGLKNFFTIFLSLSQIPFPFSNRVHGRCRSYCEASCRVDARKSTMQWIMDE